MPLTYQCSHQWWIQTLSYRREVGGGGGELIYLLSRLFFPSVVSSPFLTQNNGEGVACVASVPVPAKRNIGKMGQGKESPCSLL